MKLQKLGYNLKMKICYLKVYVQLIKFSLILKFLRCFLLIITKTHSGVLKTRLSRNSHFRKNQIL